MTELQYLARRERRTARRLRRTFSTEDGGAPPRWIERIGQERPWLTVGGAAAIGALVGAVSRRCSVGTLAGLAGRWIKPGGAVLQRVLLAGRR